ncbi:hypothetical protein C2E23DRAFT_860479 [Lenzites betulinus]|nr:hypothetical protein C2E23DRAFT_860479 [Lenzites betulinus]
MSANAIPWPVPGIPALPRAPVRSSSMGSRLHPTPPASALINHFDYPCAQSDMHPSTSSARALRSRPRSCPFQAHRARQTSSPQYSPSHEAAGLDPMIPAVPTPAPPPSRLPISSRPPLPPPPSRISSPLHLTQSSALPASPPSSPTGSWRSTLRPLIPGRTRRPATQLSSRLAPPHTLRGVPPPIHRADVPSISPTHDHQAIAHRSQFAASPDVHLIHQPSPHAQAPELCLLRVHRRPPPPLRAARVLLCRSFLGRSLSFYRDADGPHRAASSGAPSRRCAHVRIITCRTRSRRLHVRPPSSSRLSAREEKLRAVPNCTHAHAPPRLVSRRVQRLLFEDGGVVSETDGRANDGLRLRHWQPASPPRGCSLSFADSRRVPSVRAHAARRRARPTRDLRPPGSPFRRLEDPSVPLQTRYGVLPYAAPTRRSRPTADPVGKHLPPLSPDADYPARVSTSCTVSCTVIASTFETSGRRARVRGIDTRARVSTRRRCAAPVAGGQEQRDVRSHAAVPIRPDAAAWRAYSRVAGGRVLRRASCALQDVLGANTRAALHGASSESIGRTSAEAHAMLGTGTAGARWMAGLVRVQSHHVLIAHMDARRSWYSVSFTLTAMHGAINMHLALDSAVFDWLGTQRATISRSRGSGGIYGDPTALELEPVSRQYIQNGIGLAAIIPLPGLAPGM